MVARIADVVVVGMGNAAQAAAVAAHDAGAKVLVLEKAPIEKRGGNSYWTQSAQFRFVHKGVEDVRKLVTGLTEDELLKLEIPPYTKDDFYGDIMRVTQGRALPELAELLVNESNPTVYWMKEQGIQWDLLRTAAERVGDRLAWHHGANVINAMGGGAGLVPMWAAVLERKGIENLYGAAATRLLTNEKGAVAGLVVQDENGFSEIRCKAVILGCGGFEANPAMRAQYLGVGWDLVRVRGTRYNTGDGITMALEIGAQPFGHWSSSHSTPIDADAGDYEAGFLDPVTRKNMSHRYGWTLGIMVDTEGQRFVDEGEDFSTYTYAKFGAEIQKQPGGIVYQIYDAKTTPLLPQVQYAGATPIIAQSIEELAQKLDINAEGLLKTVEEFNRGVREDRGFNHLIRDGKGTIGVYPPKSNWAQKLDAPPFTAYAAACGITFTYGGLKINARCQVINRLDQPIRGLYACGEIAAGFFYYNYPGGSGLMRGAVSGRVAGTNAASD